LLGTLLNFTLSKRLFKVKFTKVQNWLGIILMLGIVIGFVENYMIFTNQDNPAPLLSKKSMQYTFRLFYPLIFLGLNLPSTLRKGGGVPLVSLIIFLSPLFEFYIIWKMNGLSFSAIDHVSTDPIKQILIAGPMLYVTLVLIQRYLIKNKTINE
jgi:hypothetical protein